MRSAQELSPRVPSRVPAPADVAALAVAARDGSRSAWNEIVDRYAPLVWGVGRRYGLGRRDVQDVGRIVWLRLVEHLADLGDPATLPRWIAVTARNESLRVVRAGRSWQQAELRFGPQLFAAPSWNDIERETERLQAHVALRVAFRARCGLPADPVRVGGQEVADVVGAYRVK